MILVAMALTAVGGQFFASREPSGVAHRPLE